MMTIGVLAWALLLPATLLVRRPPSRPVVARAHDSPAVAPGASLTVSQAITSKHFLVLGFTFFACCAAHSGPIFHVISYATWCGIGPMAATSIYSVEGIGGLAGRILLGVLADRTNVKWVLVTGLLVQSPAIGAYLSARQLSEFYVIAAVFGMAYGGVMPLYAVLAREYFGQNIMGSVFGAATMLSGFGMALGPLAGGWVFDHFGTYTWMYIAASAMAAGAALLALFFPRGSAQPRMPLQTVSAS